MRQVISFDRVKLTNNEMDDKGHVGNTSGHTGAVVLKWGYVYPSGYLKEFGSICVKKIFFKCMEVFIEFFKFVNLVFISRFFLIYNL